MVLDEPNASLDAEGEAALTTTLLAVRERGGIVVIIAHRPNALTAVDMIAVIQNGRMTAFGGKDEIIGPKVVASAEPKSIPAEAVRIKECAS